MSERQPEHLLGDSPAMQTLFRDICELAPTRYPLLIRGETGSGKEVTALEVHAQSSRSEAKFVPVNCGRLQDSTAASELFGYVKGAFTGATENKKGLFELANKGTLFLDEVGDLTPSGQTALLRALNDGSIQPIGAEEKKVDVRVVAATNLPLEEMVRSGKFRPEILNRFVGEIVVPPLRERGGDIGKLAEHIMRAHRNDEGCNREASKLAPAAVERLAACDWPGNVRDLKTAVQRALAKSAKEGCTELRLEHFDLRCTGTRSAPTPSPGSGPAASSPRAAAARATRDLAAWIMDEIAAERLKPKGIPDLVDNFTEVDLAQSLADVFFERHPRDQDEAARLYFGYRTSDAVRKHGRPRR